VTKNASLFLAGWALWALTASVVRAGAIEEFQTFAKDYSAASPAERPMLVNAYLAAQKSRGGFPVTDSDGEIVFVYVAEIGDSDIRLLGDFSPKSFYDPYWSRQGEPMDPLVQGGSVFIKRRHFDPDARLNYAFRTNGQYRLDPLNSHTDVGGPQGDEADAVSEVTLPDFRGPTEANARPDVPHGEINPVGESWATPHVEIYLPPGYSATRRYPVVYTADGAGWRRYMHLPDILDNLIADHTIAPAIAVMIDATDDRNEWYQWNPEYLRYLARVVEYVDQHYSTRADPGGRIHFGSSAGGRAALFAGLQRPDLFGELALFSPSLRSNPSVLAPYFLGERRPAKALRVWMSAGSYEGAILDDVNLLDRYFNRVHLQHRVVYRHAGHNVGTWRQVTREALIYFLPVTAR
jgi:enterochelin esterase-like enzyme